MHIIGKLRGGCGHGLVRGAVLTALLLSGGISLAKDVDEVARERVTQHQAAPNWFKRLLSTKVGTYFPTSRTREITEADRTRLLGDVTKVFRHFESEDTSQQFEGFIEQQLKPFVASLKSAEIDRPVVGDISAEPVARWSLESVVVKKMVAHLGRFRDFGARAVGLVTGKHLKGASFLAVSAVSWAALYHFFPAMTWTATASLASVAGVVLTGPVNAVTTAAGGFFVRPTTELVKTLGARLTGNLEAKINRGYDGLVERYFSAGNIEQNDTVRVATFDEEHTDFAGMSAEDQLKNWSKGLNIFIMVQNIFGRLLRDTHHGGRDLMMLSWTDSQNIAQLVETLDVKDNVLFGNQMAALAPYRHALIARGDISGKNELDRHVAHFNHLTEKVWLDPDANQARVDALAGEIETSIDVLRQYGLNDGEIKLLIDVQRQRGRAMAKLITAVSVGHLRQFYGAERNRNLAKDAHHIAHAIQVGLGTEEYTERFLPLVRRQLRLMGLEYSDADPASPLDDPAIVARERCLIDGLRRELDVLTTAKPETYACVNALIGFDAHRDLTRDAGSPAARVMALFESHANKLEAGGIIKYAMTMSDDATRVQSRVANALARCH